jgi:hypothetical protein
VGDESVICPACGAKNVATAVTCIVCGEALGASPHVSTASAEAPERKIAPAVAKLATPVSATSRPPGGVHGRRGLVGVARDVRTRTQELDQVLTFRVDRFDEAGRSLQSLPVEMRGRRVRGFISDGDWVELGSHWREGELLQPARVRNLTTSSSVQARGRHSTVLRLTLFVVFLVVVAFVFIQFVVPQVQGFASNS